MSEREKNVRDFTSCFQRKALLPFPTYVSASTSLAFVHLWLLIRSRRFTQLSARGMLDASTCHGCCKSFMARFPPPSTHPQTHIHSHIHEHTVSEIQSLHFPVSLQFWYIPVFIRIKSSDPPFETIILEIIVRARITRGE